MLLNEVIYLIPDTILFVFNLCETVCARVCAACLIKVTVVYL